ncbi:MAG: nitroreductase family protein [Candidatus Omnitrophica bacterium]|nr:nitroreductase family protein [Candidatus Omnitrophota bacterium]
MDFFDVIKKRVSVREFLDKPVSRNDINRIIDAGRLAATARNEQPWRFVGIVDKSKVSALGRIVSPNGAFMVSAPAAIVVLSVETKYYLEDCSAATENILLAARALGIGSCWIAGDKKEYADKVVEFVGGGRDQRLVSVIAIGYPAKPETVRDKKPFDDLLRWL